MIPVALKTGKFKILHHANVFAIRNDGTTGQSVLYYDSNGPVQEQPADIIVLATYVFNNARLLLISKLGKPYDPVSNTGVVGRNYAYQTGGAGATGWFKNKKFHRYMGSGAHGVAIDDFNGDNFDHSGLGFIGGGSISAGQSGARPIQSLTTPPGTPAFGRDWKLAIRKYYKHVISVGFQGESPAYQTHYLDLDPKYRDTYGNPLVRITFDWEPNERKMVAFAGTKTLPIMQAIGPDIIVGGPGSLPGPLRRDPVPVDPQHRRHDHGRRPEHLGRQQLPADVGRPERVRRRRVATSRRTPGFNPTGTVGALAYRAAEGILKYHQKGGSLV